MSELTNERLEEYARDGRNAGDCEVEQMARELLSLRSLRDAGDEEVNLCLRGNNVVYQNRSGGWDSQLVYPDFCRLRDIAITRGQQLREAREEIARLKKVADNAEQLGLMFRNLEVINNGNESKITALTAERDAARKEFAILSEEYTMLLDGQKAIVEAGKDAAAEVVEYIVREKCQDEHVATLAAELAALKSAPAMAEVDACIFTPEPYQYGVTTVYSETKYDGKKLADLARRSIASRDEVVGMLKRFQETSRKVVDVFGGTMDIEIDDATWRRGFEVWQELKGLLEIVGSVQEEGKSCTPVVTDWKAEEFCADCHKNAMFSFHSDENEQWRECGECGVRFYGL